MSRWITLQQDFIIQIDQVEWYGSIQSASTKQQSDETLKDIKAIVEWKPNGINTWSISFFQLIQNYLFESEKLLVFYFSVLFAKKR